MCRYKYKTQKVKENLTRVTKKFHKVIKNLRLKKKSK